MNNLENAVSLSFEEWINSYSEDTEWAPSKSHNREIKRIISYAEKGKYHFTSLSRAVKIAIIAAIILLLSIITVFAIPQTKDFIVDKFINSEGNPMFSYNIKSPEHNKVKDDLSLSYIPEGYILTKKETNDIIASVTYSNIDNNNKFFIIDKYMENMGVDSDAENAIYEEREYNGIKYVIITTTDYQNNPFITVIWNTNSYLYNVSGNLSSNEIWKIAISTK